MNGTEVREYRKRYRSKNLARMRELQRAAYARNREVIKGKNIAHQAKRIASGASRWDLEQAKAAEAYAVMTYEEIAKALGITKQSVGNICNRALRKLRDRAGANLAMALSELRGLAEQ